MTFIHFVNCAVLTFGPIVVVYKACQLQKIQPVLYSGLFYLLSQFAKLFLLATFVPSMDEDHSFLLTQELMIAYITVVDLICLYIFLNNRHIRGNFRSQLLNIALGWTAAESLLERLIPLWIGARAIEFQWDYILLSITGTLSIFYFYSIATFVWFWTRDDLPSSMTPVVMGSFLVSVGLPMLFKFLEVELEMHGFYVFGIKAVIVMILFASSKLLVSRYEKEKQKQQKQK